MCGIACIIDSKNKVCNDSNIRAMIDIIAHRGPDDSSTKLHPGTALGHRRLAIVGISPSGCQPMCETTGRYWIIFNGEIYNYLDIKIELIKLGYVFATETDTEVILNAYAAWGQECLHRFNGMWSFIIYDTVKEIIFASRDRFGVKPIYYWKSKSGILAFASEIKEFTVLPEWEAILNQPRAYDYMMSECGITDHTNETLFAGVYQLRGGEAVSGSITDKNIMEKVYKWYNLTVKSNKGDYACNVQKFKDIFTDSVKMRMSADVTLGSCLSGGLDSSSIVCIMNQINNDEKLKTFSIYSHNENINEQRYVEEVVKGKNISAKSATPDSSSLLKDLDNIIYHQDEPFTSSSIFVQYMVFKLAANEGIKVMLDGQGSDEQLCGYVRSFAYKIACDINSLKLLDAAKGYMHASKFYKEGHKSLLIKVLYYLSPQVLRYKLKDAVFANKISSLFNIKPGDKYNYYIPAGDIVQQNSYEQLIYNVLPQLLHYEDRNSMANSIESRVPFLDYRFVELCMNMSPNMKIDGRTKRVLRDAMSGVIPDMIRDRTDKIGFCADEETWIRGDSYKFREMLEDSVENSKGIINPAILDEYDAWIEGDRTCVNMSIIWRAIILGRWMKIFNVDI